MTVADQARVFAAMMLCGAAIGMLHDLLAVCRGNPYFTAVADLLLGIGGGLGVIAVGLMLCCDPFRLYTALGVGGGWTVYALSLGRGVRILAAAFEKLSKKVVNRAKNSKCLQEKVESERI